MDKNYGYKHTKGFLVFFVFIIILLLLAPVFGQTISSTGNLVNNTQTNSDVTSNWQNGYYVNSLTCWQGGDPNCSPGTPYVRPGSNINFSYNYTELYQNLNVAKALPNTGTGLVTTGFTFSWRSKNGNGWDNGNLDQLKAYVQGYTKSGQWIENYNYNLNFIHDWTDFTWNQNWSKDRRSTDLSTIVFGFAGKDNNFWMGPYGPEVTNVSFQLKYKPDPCVNNSLYSPDCPNFQETLQKNLTITSTVNENFKQNTEPQTVYQPTTSLTKVSVESNSKFNVQAPENTKEQKLALEITKNIFKQNDKVIQQNAKQSEQTTNQIILVNVDTGNTGQQNSNQSVKDSKTQQNVALSITPINSSIQTKLNNEQKVIIIQDDSNQIMSQDQTFKVESKLSNTSVISQQLTENYISSQQIKSESNSSFVTQNSSPTLSNNVSENVSITTNFLTNKTDPINRILENQSHMIENRLDSTTQQVNSNVQDNEAAGGVTIDSIARTPIGFNSYMIALKDSNFYTPKEIYRNQKTVDNVRALRQLASDRLHQEMVDQQYRR